MYFVAQNWRLNKAKIKPNWLEKEYFLLFLFLLPMIILSSSFDPSLKLNGNPSLNPGLNSNLNSRLIANDPNKLFRDKHSDTPLVDATPQQSASRILVSHSPISISSNLDFTQENGVIGGNGTQEFPYIISGWLISSFKSERTGIFLENTDKYCIIRNCHITMISCGIEGYNASNLVIDDVLIDYLESPDGDDALANAPGSDGEDCFGILLSGDNNRIIDITIHSLTAGKGGNGYSSSDYSTRQGCHGGGVIGISVSGQDINIENSTISQLTAGDGGTGGYGPFNSILPGGTGGSGRYCFGLEFEGWNITVKDLTIEDLKSGTGGKGGRGANSNNNDAGDGGTGGYSGICCGVIHRYSYFVTLRKINIFNLTSGDGGDGGDGGSTTVALEPGAGGNGRNGGDVSGFQIQGGQDGSISQIQISQFNMGNFGIKGSPGTNSELTLGSAGGDGAPAQLYGLYISSLTTYSVSEIFVTGLDVRSQSPYSSIYGMYLTYCESSTLWLNSFDWDIHIYSTSNGLNSLSNNFWGNYWGPNISNTLPDRYPRDGIGDEALSFGDPIESKDMFPLIFPLVGDFDEDGISNLEEYKLFLNPGSNDTDGDGLFDGWERDHMFSPLNPADAMMDGDVDGLNTLAEVYWGTDVWDPDSDDDGWLDGEEVLEETDPMDALSFPEISTTIDPSDEDDTHDDDLDDDSDNTSSETDTITSDDTKEGSSIGLPPSWTVALFTLTVIGLVTALNKKKGN